MYVLLSLCIVTTVNYIAIILFKRKYLILEKYVLNPLQERRYDVVTSRSEHLLGFRTLHKNRSYRPLSRPVFPVDLVKFTEEILNWKLHFLCSGHYANAQTQSKLKLEHLILGTVVENSREDNVERNFTSNFFLLFVFFFITLEIRLQKFAYFSLDGDGSVSDISIYITFKRSLKDLMLIFQSHTYG